VKVKNQGNANLTYTIGSQSGTLTPGQSITVNEDISSFTIQAASGTQAFELRAKEKGTEKTEDNSSDVISPSFTLSNGMLMADGTHYTQKGYNLMGAEGAKNVSIYEDTNSISTNEEIKRYGSIQVVGDQIYRKVACTIVHNGTSFVLKNVADAGTYRSSFVKSISIDANQILVNLPMNIGDIVDLNAQVNNVGMDKSLKASLVKKADIDKLVIELYGDITAFVDTATGAVTYPPNGTGVWFKYQSVPVNDNGRNKDWKQSYFLWR
jgi:hypothetical protein